MLLHVEDSKDYDLVVKRINDTRWCARVDATMTLSIGDSSFQKALHVIAEDMTLKLQVIHEAKCFLNDLSKKENMINASFWAVVLNRINGVNKS
ncbi:uncharacterized protein TNCT_286361 [Trichonephila clavata]|uniref:Uncharacterized protein n=1 Tax=Trichonephila clavata TaxID=2740835 RepID=A0A8X6FWQ1_TRICU|nr:uncharacterized protein TNCT_286361 [Trichonephila clavata]